ncbi:MAG: hypothetical protein GF331_07905 [Chitinivibrionales bacterium]|nr:hypothetical protein [Chitinivibrionales bacterium]
MHEAALTNSEQGVCVEQSESKPNWMRIAAPVFSSRPENIPDALGITIIDMPRDFDAGRLIAAVQEAARRATGTLRTYHVGHVVHADDAW